MLHFNIFYLFYEYVELATVWNLYRILFSDWTHCLEDFLKMFGRFFTRFTITIVKYSLKRDNLIICKEKIRLNIIMLLNFTSKIFQSFGNKDLVPLFVLIVPLKKIVPRMKTLAQLIYVCTCMFANAS